VLRLRVILARRAHAATLLRRLVALTGPLMPAVLPDAGTGLIVVVHLFTFFLNAYRAMAHVALM
jgi:hypothetical protein